MISVEESLTFLASAPLENAPESLKEFIDRPVMQWIIALFVIMGIVLAYLKTQTEALDKTIANLQSVWTRLSGSASSTAPAQEFAETRKKLIAAFQTKVAIRLEDALHQNYIIPLEWGDRRNEVGRRQPRAIIPDEEPRFRLPEILNPLRLLKRPHQATVTLDDRTMIDAFNQTDVSGRLLILGEPGSGKTTTLLELAQQLAESAEADETSPFPIIFELSAWKNDKQPIDQWLVAQLKEEYSVPVETSQHWILQWQLLPLLDGLDELGMERQMKCTEKINEFLSNNLHQRTVVCCRTQEFQQGGIQFTALNGAVELQPLSDNQIRGYLQQVGRPSLWQTIQASEDLHDLAQKPLLLTVMVTALQRESVSSQQELFEAYRIDRFEQYEQTHGKLLYSRQQTTRYLAWLAQTLKEQSQTEFLIEKMQPSWLDTRTQVRIYQLFSGLFCGLFCGLLIYISSGGMGSLSVG
ncbi:MAG: NACHT domain-containing protein [Elainellaceae cyanobacterium]